MKRLRAGVVLGLALACRESGDAPAPLASASAGAGSAESANLPSERATGLARGAERVRIRNVRALAERPDARTFAPLLGALADESPEVVRLAAFGLGLGAAGREQELDAALTLRAAGLLAASERAPVERAFPAIAEALARSATPEAERTLRAWLALEPPLAEAAALALGKLAGKRGTLEETTFRALLDEHRAPLESALYALSRVRPPDGPINQRALAVATRALQGAEIERRFAVRALGRLGEGAASALERAFERAPSTAERAEIAREIARTGKAGKRVLVRLLLASEAALSASGLGTPTPRSPARTIDLGTSPGESDVLLALLEALGERSPEARPLLERLARLALPTDPDSERERARAVELRCAAARLLAREATLNPDLRACDPDPKGRTGKLALLGVLDSGKLRGARAKPYHELLVDEDALVRQAALRLVPGHRELELGTEPFVKALADTAPGVVAAAAEVLSLTPGRALQPSASGGGPSDGGTERADRADPALVAAVHAALARAEATHNVAVHAALIDLAGALSLLSERPAIERACRTENRTLREHAERALNASGRAKVSCEGGAHGDAPQHALAPTAKRLIFETDVGELVLELQPELAPRAAARLVELSASGFYAGTRVHRSVPGFAVQLGDPGEDGYGGAPLPALPTELAPDPFEPFSVGIATSGRDTGSSQFFVTLGRFPHLDGEYTRVGHAGPGWDKLRVGDRIQRVRVE